MNEPGLDRTPRFSNSPRWSSTTKMVVAITLVAITGGLLLRFRQIIGPILASFVLAYLMYPLASLIVRRVRISWRFAVTLLYLLLLMIIIGSLTASGLALVEQVQSSRSPSCSGRYANFRVHRPAQWTRIDLFGMFVLDFNQLNLDDITNSILGVVQPMLSELGSLVGATLPARVHRRLDSVQPADLLLPAGRFRWDARKANSGPHSWLSGRHQPHGRGAGPHLERLPGAGR